MSAPNDHSTHPHPVPDPSGRGPVSFDKPDPHSGHAHHARSGGHGGHSWMMIACCIPMLLIAVALVATGVASPAFLLVAVMCTAMMAMMMRGMHDS